MIDISQNYSIGLPVAASTYAGQVDKSLHILHIGMVAIFVLWSIFFVYCLVRFHRKKTAQAAYHGWKGHASSFVPDAAVLIFELWLIFFLGLPIWSHIKEEFPKPEESNLVEMSAQQFSWGFHYAGPDGKFGRKDSKFVDISNPLALNPEDPAGKDDIVFFNELRVPVNKPTILYMTSKDVIHSFFVPEFRVKQDVVPGMRTPLWFTPTREGAYEIGCAQLCGVGHYVMRGDVLVQRPEDFEKWLSDRAGEKQATATAPTEDWSE
jgi:cytochrome c oxidase subunit 2